MKHVFENAPQALRDLRRNVHETTGRMASQAYESRSGLPTP